MPDLWLGALRRLHDENFGSWDEHLRKLNLLLELTDDPLSTPAPGLPPAWFVGDVEALQPREWVLVFSLNQAHKQEHEAWHKEQRYTAQTYWDHWRFLNRDYWRSGFYRPLVRLASKVLNVPFDISTEAAFATTRMVFVELAPYSSRGFLFAANHLATLADQDRGFRVAAEVGRILIEEASPTLVLVNGVDAIDDFERLSGDRAKLEVRQYASTKRPNHTLWHKKGIYRSAGDPIPVIGFPFLRTPSTHNFYAEIDQLGARARALLGRPSLNS